ncbi:hypothetical protein EBR44_12405 [bacterium]|nr:hypothetical protein [bacterium]
MNTVDLILSETTHAYMRPMYGETAWKRIAAFLAREGYNALDAARLMNSKHMRWADDAEGSGRKNEPNSATFRRYYDRHKTNGGLIVR